MTKERMIDNICARWGYENPVTIHFCNLVEQGHPMSILRVAYHTAMTLNVYDGE